MNWFGITFSNRYEENVEQKRSVYLFPVLCFSWLTMHLSFRANSRNKMHAGASGTPPAGFLGYCNPLLSHFDTSISFFFPKVSAVFEQSLSLGETDVTSMCCTGKAGSSGDH